MLPPPNDQGLVSGSANKAKAAEALSAEAIPGQYIVVFKDQNKEMSSSQAAQKALQTTQSILSEHTIADDSVMSQYQYALKGFAAKLTAEQVKQLKKDPRVDHISKNKIYRLAVSTLAHKKKTSTRRNVLFSSQTIPWGVDRVGGPLDGTGKTAWILDTGIDQNHDDLNVDTQNSISYIPGETADDNIGHGTYVAGILAAENNSKDLVGVAAGAKVVAVKVCTISSITGRPICPQNSILDGIDYVYNHANPNDIINMSLGGPGDPDLDNAVIDAADTGLRFTIASGNNKDDAGNYSPARVEHPNVWTVSAFAQGDNFSVNFNCGPGCFAGSNFGNPPIEFSGPGEDVPSLVFGGGSGLGYDPSRQGDEDGTSYAAPHLAGLLLVMGAEPNHSGFVSNDPDGDPDEIASYRLQPSTLMASVQNDSPRLDWSSIIGAQSYEVYRKFETGNWVFVANTANTYYVDNVINSPDLETLAQPPYDYEDFYSYRVKAIATVGGDQYSNTEYFLFECTGIPCSNSVEH